MTGTISKIITVFFYVTKCLFSLRKLSPPWKICFLGFFKSAFDFHGNMLWKFSQVVKDFLIEPVKSGNITVWLFTKELTPSSQILDFLKEKLQYHRSLKYKRKISPSSHNFNFSKEKSITVRKFWQKSFSPSSESVDL